MTTDTVSWVVGDLEQFRFALVVVMGSLVAAGVTVRVFVNVARGGRS